MNTATPEPPAPDRYAALALQFSTACVNDCRDRDAARQRMAENLARVGATVAASKGFIRQYSGIETCYIIHDAVAKEVDKDTFFHTRESGGTMLSFELQGGRAAANAFTRACPDIAFAPTLGDIGTTLSHPASSSHRALTPEARAAIGISEGFFRVSVGVEPVEMLIGEMCQAAEAAGKAS